MVVNDCTWDEPEFLPLFKAAESMGAVLFFHPQPQDNLVLDRIDRYSLSNSIGVPVEDALMVATLIFGGILDACPDLKVCIAHGGGPACFGIGRMDRGWQVRREARMHIQKPPSTYLRRLYYDCVTNSEPALRYLIDHVGIERVVLGSDWPFVQWEPSCVGWVQHLQSLTQAEKDKILWQNLEQLLGL
jgi:aminocarboxymuconate-semialdehyde decarboxylase